MFHLVCDLADPRPLSPATEWHTCGSKLKGGKRPQPAQTHLNLVSANPSSLARKFLKNIFFIYLNDNMFWKEITSLLWSQLHHQHLNCAFSTRLRSACPSMFSNVKSSKKPGEATVGANSVDPHLRITIFTDPVVTWQMCAAALSSSRGDVKARGGSWSESPRLRSAGGRTAYYLHSAAHSACSTQ